MKNILKIIIAPSAATFLFMLFLLLLIIFMIDDDVSGSMNLNGMGISEEVNTLLPMVEQYCKEYKVEEYIDYILAIIQVESGGKGKDVMQCSESLGLPPNSLEREASIKQGCFYFSKLLESAEKKGCDLNTVIQSYNYGGDFIDYVAVREKQYTFKLAQDFAEEKSKGVQVLYSNQIAVDHNGGWRYEYGNMFYVQLILQYIAVEHIGEDVAEIILKEALKYQNLTYVFGGDRPSTSFDCSGLVQWCFQIADITLPRTAQEQYEATWHISARNVQAGDLVFFHSTYDTDAYITHVGIYVGDNRMFHAGNPIGYADLSTDYWQDHFVSFGRVKTNN